MTDSKQLIERLRDAARHRCSFLLGSKPEDMDEWKAADEISELREALKPFADEYETVPTAYYRREDVDARLVNAPTANRIMLSDLRRAHAKLQGDGS